MNLKYGQKVKVTSGFYEGMEGTVIKELQDIIQLPEYVGDKMMMTLGNSNKYKCLLRSHLDEIESDFIPESSLELIK